MNIGIIGAGGIGQALAAHVAKAGYEVIAWGGALRPLRDKQA